MLPSSTQTNYKAIALIIVLSAIAIIYIFSVSSLGFKALQNTKQQININNNSY